MNINLTKELKTYVESKVQSGMFNNVSEVIRQALRVFHEQETVRTAKLEALRAFVKEGVDAVEKGETVDGETYVNELLDEVRRM